MKLTARRTFKSGKNSAMIAGGIGKRGPYAYFGVKNRPTGLSAGASIGLEGRNLYASMNRSRFQARLKYNRESRTTNPRLRIFKKKG